MKQSLFFLCFFFAIQTCTFSQNPSEEFLGSWYTYSLNHKFSERYSINPYAELRFYEPSSNYNLAFFSIRGHYHLNPKTAFSLGYAFLDIDRVFEFDQVPNLKEHRLSEQYTYQHNLGKFTVQHRVRLEHRFFDNQDVYQLKNRIRYRIHFKYKINKTLFVSLWEEPFVNFQDQVFHENRFYTGLGFTISKHAQLQIGYIKQHIRKANLNRLQIGVSIKTSSIKPQHMALVSQ